VAKLFPTQGSRKHALTQAERRIAVIVVAATHPLVNFYNLVWSIGPPLPSPISSAPCSVVATQISPSSSRAPAPFFQPSPSIALCLSARVSPPNLSSESTIQLLDCVARSGWLKSVGRGLIDRSIVCGNSSLEFLSLGSIHLLRADSVSVTSALALFCCSLM
jgi:hypothetical protein